MNGASSDLTQKSNQIPMAEISGSAGSGDGYAYQNHTPINSSTEHYKHGMSSPPKPKSSPLKPSKSSSMSPKPAKLSSSSQNGHHNKHKSSHSSDGERHKSGHHSDKPRDPQSKPKDPNARPKDHSSHHHSSSSKPKDPSKHSSSSSSSSSKHKDGSIKPREGSSTKLKEGSQSSSTSKHKDSSSKHKDGSSSKPKEGSSSSSRPKDGSSSSGHKPSSSSKHKDHSSKSSDASRHKEHSSGSSFTSSGSSSTKPVSKESSKHAESSDKKIRDESGKHKLAKKSGDKHKTDKHREKSSADGVKVKSESMSPTKLVIKTEKVDSHRPQIKKEAGESDDDIPLASRAQLAAGDFKVKKEKRRHESGSEDDESLASRAEKIKKQKTEVSVKKESKKRKMERDEDYDVKKKKDKTKKGSVKEEPPKKKAKKEKEVEEVWKWWEETPHPEGVKWMTLSHRGPVFAPEYEPLPDDVKFYYDGKLMKLGLAAEEVAGFYARMLDHDYTTKAVFNKNFFKDWRKEMTHEEKATIVDLKKCDFREIRDYYLKKSEERKNMSKAEKDAIKKKNEEIVSEYGFCIIDGHKQKIGNFKIEPPGLFRGRGDHPKQGMLKKRLQPEDVTINVGKDAEVPAPPKGHKWKEVIHDNKVTWLASWSENIQGANKYVMLNANSRLKGEKDWQKYETARKLKSLVDKIRENYKEDWRSKEMRIRQRAVALYFIDKLALRAGNEKEEGETADTVGCCSLRVEHITLHQEYQGKEFVVGFDFLGKDSIRYVNHVPVEKRVFKNLQLFMENKQPGDDLFDRLNTSILNKHLQELMEGLTAKVFRTFNASKTLQEQLNELTEPDDSVPAKILAYNRANRAVAILCNHQRAAPKTFDKQMSNLQEKIEKKHVSIKDVKKEYKRLKSDYKTSRDDRMKSALERKKKQLERLEEQLMKLEVQATDKEENKEIALGTSKLNYLDPRISVAWCKKWNVPLEKIYNRTQRDKFQWAIDMADETYEF